MEIRINKSSGVPVRQQLEEQILLLIVTGRLKPGSPMPSVRELARRLKIHHNTVSEAYKDLVRRQWLDRRRGSHLTVRGMREGMPLEGALSLDDIVDLAIRVAREQGYTLQELRRRVREILAEKPPDHILLVAEDSRLRRLLQFEIQQALEWPVESCSEKDLAGNRGLAIGALVATPAFALPEVGPMVPRSRPPVPLNFAPPDYLVTEVGKLSGPSIIAVVSASDLCLRAAAGLLAPAIGEKHSLVQFLWPLENSNDLDGADLLLCDSLVAREIRKKRCVSYKLIDPESIHHLGAAMISYQER
jgi:GntR family transcriptional regulator